MAWRQSGSIGTAWRIRYNMPPNDPRYLGMTEEEMLHDLLVQHYYHAAVDIQNQPQLADRERWRADPKSAQRFVEEANAFVDDAATLAALAKLWQDGKQKQEARTLRFHREAPDHE